MLLVIDDLKVIMGCHSNDDISKLAKSSANFRNGQCLSVLRSFWVANLRRRLGRTFRLINPRQVCSDFERRKFRLDFFNLEISIKSH